MGRKIFLVNLYHSLWVHQYENTYGLILNYPLNTNEKSLNPSTNYEPLFPWEDVLGLLKEKATELKFCLSSGVSVRL